VRDVLNDLAESQQFGWQMVRGFVCYLPSPEEIRHRCEAIQVNWSNEERYKRRTAMPYQVGVHRCRDLRSGLLL
jgi:hypothetical protein